jgi:small subunit ribosomal protein S1
MSDQTLAAPPVEAEAPIDTEPVESFGDQLKDFERTHRHRAEDGSKQLEGTVVSVTADAVYLDIGYKSEGVLPPTAFGEKAVAVGDRFSVSSKGRNEEGYYDLSLMRIAPVTDWGSLEEAFAAGSAIAGTVTAVVKGGFSVDVGVRAFLPTSRSGIREAGEAEKLVGQAIDCRILKLDAADEDVVVDRRAILEEQASAVQAERYGAMREGDIVEGTVRSLTSYGAFVELGGIDGLLHISDMAWSRVEKAEDVLTVGESVRVKVLKIEAAKADGKGRISLGMKQLQAAPWDTVTERYTVGQRVTGTVSRLMDFGAFVELEPGIEGLIHVSEMSWVKKVRKPGDMLAVGDTVEAMVLGVDVPAQRMSLGLKQALGDPWASVAERFAVGSAIEGPVTRMMNFGAFVQLTEGVEGLVHVSEIGGEKRINHPQEVLRVGQVVKAQVLGIDVEKRQIKLSIKQAVPTGLDEFLAEHAVGDVVSGRMVSQSGEVSVVELGEGVRATCKAAPVVAPVEKKAESAIDFSALGSMLKAKWTSGAGPVTAKKEGPRVGSVVSVRIVGLDVVGKTVEVEVVN